MVELNEYGEIIETSLENDKSSKIEDILKDVPVVNFNKEYEVNSYKKGLRETVSKYLPTFTNAYLKVRDAIKYRNLR